MPSRTLFKKAVPLVIIIAAFGITLSIRPVHAQTAGGPQFLITWKTTGSYIPSFYKGKALPTYGSKITADVELVSPTGKVLDLSGQTIYWYLDDNLVGGGTGVQQVTFSPVGEAPSISDLRVTLPSYNGNYLVQSVQIPMVLPEAVLYAPYPNGQFSQNPLAVKAIPFFFNTPSASALSYTWGVNGQSGSNTENPQDAQITLPTGTQSGTALNVTLSIQNANDSTVGTANETLTYQSQL
jgi:hypothetical protein